MGPGADDERDGPFARESDEAEAVLRDLEVLIDEARRLGPDQLKALIRLIRETIAEQEP